MFTPRFARTIAVAAALAMAHPVFAEDPSDCPKGGTGTTTGRTRSGDLTNFNFNPSVFRANPRVLSEADANDRRLSKVRKDPSVLISTADTSASSDILFTNITGPTTPLPIVINEELLLTRAEILWGLGRDAEAITLVNFIRTTSGGSAARNTYATGLI